MTGNATTPPADFEAEIRRLGPWFHNLDLLGVKTAPDHFLGDYPAFKWRKFSHAIPAKLQGKTVLDVGCNGGFYSIEMKRRGASHVLAIDNDETYLAQARFAARALGEDIEFRQLDVYDVGQIEKTFDIVLFMGVLYHLRYPLLALDLLRNHVVGDLMVFQTMMRGAAREMDVKDNYAFSEEAHFEEPGYPKMHFVEGSYADDPTNWWIPNLACAKAMVRSAGFDIVSQPEEEVLLCRAKKLQPNEVRR